MEDEWFEEGTMHLIGGLEKANAEHGECLDCTMILIDDNYVHEADCPHAYDDEDDGFDTDDDEPGDFEDVADIDMLVNDAEAEAVINKEEDIPDEDLRDTVFEDVDEDGAGDADDEDEDRASDEA